MAWYCLHHAGIRVCFVDCDCRVTTSDRQRGRIHTHTFLEHRGQRWRVCVRMSELSGRKRSAPPPEGHAAKRIKREREDDAPAAPPEYCYVCSGCHHPLFRLSVPIESLPLRRVDRTHVINRARTLTASNVPPTPLSLMKVQRRDGVEYQYHFKCPACGACTGRSRVRLAPLSRAVASCVLSLLSSLLLSYK